MSVGAETAPAEGRSLPPAPEKQSLWQRYGVAAAFLAPALMLLGIWIVYPTIRTIIRSFYDRYGDKFVGLDNYQTLFTDDTLQTAIKNNFLWILIVPAFVTAIGLVFAVLLERVRFATAFKIAVFMPMAISLFAAGVIWRLMYEKDPSQGTVNATIKVAKDAVSPSGVLSNAQPSTDALQGGPKGGLELKKPIQPGSVAQMGLTAIRRERRFSGREAGGRARGALRRDHRRRLAGLQAGRRHSGQAGEGRARAPGRDRRATERRQGGRRHDDRAERHVQVRERRAGDLSRGYRRRTRSRPRMRGFPGSGRT